MTSLGDLNAGTRHFLDYLSLNGAVFFVCDLFRRAFPSFSLIPHDFVEGERKLSKIENQATSKTGPAPLAPPLWPRSFLSYSLQLLEMFPSSSSSSTSSTSSSSSSSSSSASSLPLLFLY